MDAIGFFLQCLTELCLKVWHRAFVDGVLYLHVSGGGLCCATM